MKRKISLVVLALSGCVMIGFAATKVETCADKFTSCKNTCTNAQASCKARGTDPAVCENTYAQCMKACDKAKSECEAQEKAGKGKKPESQPKKS